MEKLESILESIGQMAALDFTTEIEIDDSDDQLNAIAQGLNWLREELQNNMVERSRLEEINEKLEQVIEENEGMMHMMVHDLKAPINNIRILSKMIQDDSEKEHFEYLDREVRKAEQIISELNYYHKLEHSEIIIKSEFVELNQLIVEVVTNHGAAAKEKSIQLDFVSNINEISIQTDPLAFSRILDNLVSNAIKFSPFEKNVKVHLSRNSDSLILQINDEGPGLTKNDKKHLFKKFRPLSARPTNKEISTGLGLATVKLLTEKLGHQIEVDSEEGQGSTFRLKISNEAVEEIAI